MLITVFTPTYNRADKLHRVFASLQAQTLKKADGKALFEWVIVDDGSEDGTSDLVKRWTKEADFLIRYHYQQNRGKIHAMRKGIEMAKGEWFLSIDSDDACKKHTIEFFYKTIQGFTEEERRLCGGIGVLNEDQYGNPIGNPYPIEKKLLYTLDILFAWREKGLGETRALLKTANLKKAFTIPEEAKHLKFIPETFFWDRIVFELKPYSYFVNEYLGIYYRGEGGNISENIRLKYPEGFLFASLWFVKNYPEVLFCHPKTYLKHLAKVIYYAYRTKIERKNELQK